MMMLEIKIVILNVDEETKNLEERNKNISESFYMCISIFLSNDNLEAPLFF
jgi:hypothetical protein